MSKQTAFSKELVHHIARETYKRRFSDLDRENILNDPERGQEFFDKHCTPLYGVIREALHVLKDDFNFVTPDLF